MSHPSPSFAFGEGWAGVFILGIPPSIMCHRPKADDAQQITISIREASHFNLILATTVGNFLNEPSPMCHRPKADDTQRITISVKANLYIDPFPIGRTLKL